MNRKEKIMLLQQIAKGDNSELKIFNKRYAVVFLGIFDDVLHYIDHDLFFKIADEGSLTGEQRQQILNDPSIRKYTYSELMKLSERHIVFCVPIQMLHRPEAEIKEFYNKYFA